MILDPIRAAVAPYTLLIKAGTVLLLSIVLVIGGCNHGASKWRGKFADEVAAHKADNTAHQSIVDEMARRTARIAKRAADASKQAVADRREADARFQNAKREATRAKHDLARALRAGTVRLRDEWACAVPGTAAGGAAPAAGRQDAAAILRATGAANLVAAGDAADSWIEWLQAEVTGTRRACGWTP